MMLTSLGHQSSGVLTLLNYPIWIRNVTCRMRMAQTDSALWTWLALRFIVTESERQNCRYNEFRRRMFMPIIRKWEDLTTDPKTLAIIRELYGNDVESLDLLFGLLLEKKIPGFAFSETSFSFIFLIMATRRLEAEKLFTTYFKEEYLHQRGVEVGEHHGRFGLGRMCCGTSTRIS